MAYIKDTYELGEYMAYEYKFVGRNGAKGEKREKRRKATPEQMARQPMDQAKEDDVYHKSKLQVW